jgi:HTH-type transcriptional regulator/antitoxin HipB
MGIRYYAKDIGALIKKTRKQLKVTQKELAWTSGVGIRFVIDLEKGKPTCQLGKVLAVLHTIGINMQLQVPHSTV